MELDTKQPGVSFNIGNGLSLLASLSTSNSINSTISSVVANSVSPYYSQNSSATGGSVGAGYHHINSHYNTSGGEIKMGGEEALVSHQNEGNNKTDMEHLRPDMVPITVRSDLPQLKDITIEKVLCGTNLTWDEFLRLFHVTLDPNLHIIKGSGGRKANLLDKVGDYVKILKRRMKVYLINIELVHPAKKISKSSNSSVTSSNAAATNNAPSSSGTKRSKNNGAASSSGAKEQNRDNSSPASKRKSKKPKWVNTAAEEGLPKDSIENPEKSLSMETQVFSNSNTSTGLNTKPGKGERKKRQSRKNNKTNANNGHLGGALSGIPGPTHGFLDNFSQIPINSNEALNLISTSQSPPSKLRSTLEGYMGMPNNANELPMFPLNFSNNNGSHQINENDLTSASSNGGDDDDTTLDSKSESMFGIGEFDIKPAVVQFLVHKISNKNMLRIREELMNLKNSDDYFKLTSVAPLAAGLLEQMFCRNQPKQESN